MRRLFASLLAFCLVGAAKPAMRPVHYAVSPEFVGTELRALGVEIPFDGNADGTTRLVRLEQ